VPQPTLEKLNGWIFMKFDTGKEEYGHLGCDAVHFGETPDVSEGHVARN
jgi:hypothetical protein